MIFRALVYLPFPSPPDAAGGGVDLAAALTQLSIDVASMRQEMATAAATAAAQAARAHILSLVVQPLAPARSSLRSEETARSDHDARIALKKRVIEYYGLGVDLAGSDSALWRSRTMLCDSTSVALPFEACTLAHIWPKDKQRFADAISMELKLPDNFYGEPRNYLVLPRDAHTAFDSEALLLVPTRSGAIRVRKWRVDVLKKGESDALGKYYDKLLQWPTSSSASPCLPFMRLMAWRMMTAVREAPVVSSSASAGFEPSEVIDDVMASSSSSEGNAALKSLILRYNLIEAQPQRRSVPLA